MDSVSRGADEAEVPRRLLQDFVTTPVPYDLLQRRVCVQPSPVPAWIEGAMWSPPIPDLARKADLSGQVILAGCRERADGWSTRVGWPYGLRGFPAFDGELILHAADPAGTWVGLQGAVSLVEASSWAEHELRDAQLRLRRLLVNLSQVIIHEVR